MFNGEPDSDVGDEALPATEPADAPASGTSPAEPLFSMSTICGAALAALAASGAVLAAFALLDELDATITVIAVQASLVAVATWQTVRAWRTRPTEIGTLNVRELNRIAEARVDPQRFADLPPWLRAVAVARARQHLHQVRVAGPWIAAVMVVWFTFCVRLAIDDWSFHGVTLIYGLVAVIVPAGIGVPQIRGSRAILARVADSPGGDGDSPAP